MSAEQSALPLDIRSDYEKWMDEYRRDFAEQAKATGTTRARQADPDTFDEALRCIQRLAELGQEFGADEVRTRITPTTSTGVLGAAFREAHRRGWIVPVGVRAAKTATRHGSLQRTWRGSP